MRPFSKHKRIDKTYINSALNKTLPQLLKDNRERYGNLVEMLEKKFGIWRQYTWSESYEIVKFVFYGLKSLGFGAGEKVCIVGENAPQFHWAEFAILAASGVATAVYPDSLPEEILYIAAHSESRVIFAEDQEQVDKALQIKNEIPGLLKIIYWDDKGLGGYDDPILMSYDYLIEVGKNLEKENPGLFERTVDEGDPDDIAVFCYTSGTASQPKAVMFSHRKLLICANAWYEVAPYRIGDDEFSMISPAWAVEQFLIAVHLLSRTRVNFYEEPETAKENFREVAPNFVLYTARLWESESRRIQAKIADAPRLKRLVYNMFLPIGLKMADFVRESKKPSLFMKVLYFFGYWIVFRPILDELGLTKCRHALTSGSTISPDILNYFRALGLNIIDIYASTEVAFIASSSHGEERGEIRRGVEVRITDEGEILARADTCFLGYYKDPEKTNKAIEKGWFHTGDAGFIDDEGRLNFLDRLDDLVELSNGTKVAPQFVESKMKFSPYIRDAIVVCEDKPFVSVLVDLDFDNLTRWAEANKIPFTTLIQLSQVEQTYELIHDVIKTINTRLPSGATIYKFTNLHKNLDADEAELTRTRKLRRDLVLKRYDEIIEGIYSGKAEIAVTGVVKYRDGRTGSVTAQLKIRTVETT